MFTTFQEVFKFYTKSEVYPEIIDYLKGRWAAIEASSTEKRIFIRYAHRNGPPLRIESKDDLVKYLMRFKGLRPRTIYGSINIYRKLLSRDDTEDFSNIVFTTPIIDIDFSLDELDLGKKVLRELVDVIEGLGIVRSLYIKFSGRGFHIHIHEKSISEDIRSKYHPLDIAYSVVEYILRNGLKRISPIINESKNIDRPLKVENKIDVQRVFTVPLSFHRLVNYVNICFKPDEVDEFDLSWADPSSLHHNRNWRLYSEGEADSLALEALKEVGGYIVKKMKGEKSSVITTALESHRRRVKVGRGKIGRFQVMALLQAARYYILRGDIDKAKSFGLNRAIFYAWAKHHRPKYGISKYGMMRRQMGIKPEELPHEMLGDEMAFMSDDGWFMIGDQVQRPVDYDRQVEKKIEFIVPYELAWEAALKYLKKFPRETLERQQEFFKEVYEPVRDNFIELIIKYMEEDNQ